MGTITDGADLHASLSETAQAYAIQTATFELLGGLHRVEFSAYDFTTQTRLAPLVFERALEIVAGHGTLSLLGAMADCGIRRLVFSSSATVYGDPDEVPIREDAPLRATNPYGRSKLMVEEILKDLAASGPGWQLMTLRYFNPVGAHESALIGELPTGVPNNLVPFITQTAAGFVTAGFIAGMNVNIFGSTSNDAVTAIIQTVAAGTLTLTDGGGDLAATEAAGATIAIVAADGGSFVNLFSGGKITFFNGTQPASADDSKGGATALLEFEPLRFDDATYDSDNDLYYIDLLSSLSDNALADGTCTWFRCTAPGENRDDASTTAIRFDGSIGSSGDIVLAETTLTTGDPDTLTQFKIKYAQ